MRTSFLAFVLIISTFLSFSQEKQYQGHLWKISGNGLEKPSYLYGTMHVSNKVAFHLSDSFYKAIKSVDVVALEINPETWMESMTSEQYVADRMGNVFSMRGDYSVNGFYKGIYLLDEQDNKMIGNALGQELGILNSLLYRTSNYNAEFQEDTYLDLFIFQAGKKQGKEITGLENLGLTMRLNEQAAKPEKDKEKRKKQEEERKRRQHLVKKLLKDKSFNEVMEDAYRRGDLDLLDSLSRLSSSNDKYHELIIVYRNIGMADAMDSIMQEKSLFAGVGAAHLPNSYGVIELLREKGYTVMPVTNEKTDFGRNYKDKLENTFIAHDFDKKVSFDKSFSTVMPGPLYEFPEANNVMMAAYPDMANGATYVITRMLTFGTLRGMSQQQYMEKIDSLLYENIPGKIMEKKRIVKDGYPGFDIINKTKKGDWQRYHIIVSPIEVMIFKVGGKKEFIKRAEVTQFFDELHFNNNNAGKWSEYKPNNNAYAVNMPGNLCFEGENNAFARGFWKKNVQSFDPKDSSFFAVLNRSYSDYRFMEEDSFELSQIARQFCFQFDYELINWSHDSLDHYSGYTAYATKEGLAPLNLKLFLKGEQYYMMLAQSDDKSKVDKFMQSMRFDTFHYTRPFELQEDTTLFFNVISPVEATPQSSYYSYYYYNSDDDDETYKTEYKNATYYNKETDESIYVKYKRFHKYASELHIDSIWNDREESLLEDGDFYLRSSKRWEEDGMYYYEAEASDTNTNRNLYGRSMLKDGVMYTIYTEIDRFAPRTRFVNTFINTFEPWDTAIGTPVLQNKTEMFLADLVSEDSATREAAYNSIDVVSFEDEDAPKIIEAIERSYEKEKDLDIRADLLGRLAWRDHPSVYPYLLQKYPKVEDTILLQIPILKGVAAQKTKKSTKKLYKMLEVETPLTNNEYKLNSIFYPYYDSLQLVRELYPKMLKLASLPEYKETTYEYLVMLLDSGYVKKRVYKRKLNQLVWEATNEVKRQKSEEASREHDYYETATRYKLYGYDRDLYNYAKLLMPYYGSNRKVNKFFSRLDQLKEPGLRIKMAVLKAKNGIEVNDTMWNYFAQDKNDRIELYQELERSDMLQLFPENYANQHDLALSLFAEKENLNANRDSVTFVNRTYTIIGKDTGYMYFFKSKSKYSDNWRMGYIGLLPADSSNLILKGDYTDDSFSWSEFEDLDLQLKMQMRKLQMEERRRYRVEDEPEFKELSYGRRYYY